MGEVTITLEDVHHLLGLPTDGEVVSGRVGGHPFSRMVGDFLGVQPGRSRDLYKNQISLTFLRERYLNWHEWSGNEVDRMRYTRALILRIIGGCLFVETASSFVHARYLLFLDDFQRTRTYSWGSAVLATLYRELCKVTDPG
ncbi:serine/threonine-protein phosphatase 7 long form homolog [Gastrolobium bilobum]|uniref:serine/threonine-protein phosphatase 7 long form homolog n=1 Tax=Gastrolobium bilobum TaxID=150636 RepID=UPI002AB01BDB|nr:serine/threonine-protein phosphatase 7 long form homolog [Gastrolobium bilobum]